MISETEYKLLKFEGILSARQSLLAFTIYTKPDYQVNWHHRYVCDLLDSFATGKIKRLMIFQPPQTGKSELSSRRFPAYLLGKKPNCRISLCSYAAEVAQCFNRDVQRIIDTPEYAEVFPKTKLNRANVATSSKGSYKRTANIFEVVDHNGFFKTVGVAGQLTSTSVDIGIIDDPFKDREQAESTRIRDRVWNFYTDVFEARGDNKFQQLILLTRWHEDDLAGRILERDGKIEDGGKWTVVTLPAIKEDNDNPHDLRQVGEALWPEKHSLERMENIRKNSPRTFASLYQQRPSPDGGNIIKDEYLPIIEHYEVPNFDQIDFVSDTAYTAKQENDPSACLAYAIADGNLYLLGYIRLWAEFSELSQKLKDFVGQKGKTNSRLYIEPKASGKSIVQYLRRNTNLNVMEYKLADGDKVVRLRAVEPFLEANKVFLVRGAWNQQFIDECKFFPNGKHDEAVDCLTMAVTQGLLRRSHYKGRQVRIF